MQMTVCPSVSTKYTPCGEANPWEVYHMHWLWAKARKNRWNEEVVLLESEMGWTHKFFQSKADECDAVKKKAEEKGDHGLDCYAAWQNDLYNRLADICS